VNRIFSRFRILKSRTREPPGSWRQPCRIHRPPCHKIAVKHRLFGAKLLHQLLQLKCTKTGQFPHLVDPQPDSPCPFTTPSSRYGQSRKSLENQKRRQALPSPRDPQRRGGSTGEKESAVGAAQFSPVRKRWETIGAQRRPLAQPFPRKPLGSPFVYTPPPISRLAACKNDGRTAKMRANHGKTPIARFVPLDLRDASEVACPRSASERGELFGTILRFIL
jgi:hypothetical protein